MAGGLKGKRSAPPLQTSAKKRKLNNGKHQKTSKVAFKPKSKEPRKEKAADRGIIPIPMLGEDNVELSDQDKEVLDEFGDAAGFLGSLDRKGLMRSKKETQRLHQLTKPVRKQEIHDDLPSLDSHDEDEDSWSSGIDDDEREFSEDESSIQAPEPSCSDDSDVEKAYEAVPRKRRPSWDSSNSKTVPRLPIKLANGEIKGTGTKTINRSLTPSEDEESGTESEKEQESKVEDVSTGARFGKPAVVDILQTKSRRSRIEMAKEQIASICQEILADPENTLGLLRRLHTFALPTVTTPTHLDPIQNDPLIRKLAILSQLAIFKDIIPGYRIRALTETEKAEKVSQMVARTRDWEQGLVTAYQTYLRLLEVELKARSELADSALYCICTLLTEVTHFNFRVNLMTCVVTRLSKKSWDKTSDMCLNSLISVFREDITGAASLEVVRLLNRMIKERHFKVHPNVLSCLLQLRLKTELGVRASDKLADKPEPAKGKHDKNRKGQKVHISKKNRKVLKERKEIDKELREAEAVVDQEERKAIQTETLKLLFALYFRILKNPSPTPLLPSALSGISKFAHLVNIDFFKDLLKVLKDLISMEDLASEEDPDPKRTDASDAPEGTALRLMCIVTAFELLSGQGEALNIDLSEFISYLYAILLRLNLSPDINAHQQQSALGPDNSSVVDTLFRVLNVVFSPHTSGTAAPPWRSAAFAKRLLGAALHWPSSAVLRALDFVGALVAKDPQLEAMLSTEDRVFNGVYRPDVDDPQLCQPFQSSFFELHLLHRSHWDARVRLEAERLLNFKSS